MSNFRWPLIGNEPQASSLDYDYDYDYDHEYDYEHEGNK